MGQAQLVESQINAGDRLIQELSRRHLDVSAALWIKDDEDSDWYLYIASKEVDDRGIRGAVEVVFNVMADLVDPWLEPLDIRLISPGDPIAQDVLAMYSRYPARIPTRYRGRRLGKFGVHEAYIYPPVAPVGAGLGP